MSWLQTGLSSLTGQLGNFTREVLTEGTEEVDDLGTELKLMRSRNNELETLNAALKKEVEQLKEHIENQALQLESKELQLHHIISEYRDKLTEKERECMKLKEKEIQLTEALHHHSHHHHRESESSQNSNCELGIGDDSSEDVFFLQHKVSSLSEKIKKLETELQKYKDKATSVVGYNGSSGITTNTTTTTTTTATAALDGDSNNSGSRIGSSNDSNTKHLEETMCNHLNHHQQELASLQNTHSQNLASLKRHYGNIIDELNERIKELVTNERNANSEGGKKTNKKENDSNDDDDDGEGSTSNDPSNTDVKNEQNVERETAETTTTSSNAVNQPTTTTTQNDFNISSGSSSSSSSSKQTNNDSSSIISSLQNKLEDLEARNKKLEHDWAQVHAVDRKKTQMIEKLQSELDLTEKLRIESTQRDDADKEFEALLEENRALMEQLSQMKIKMKELNNSEQLKEAHLKRLQQQLLDQQQQLDEQQKLERQQQQLQQEADIISTANESNKDLNEYQTQIIQLKNDLMSVENERFSESEAFNQSISQLQSEVERLIDENETLNRSITELKDTSGIEIADLKAQLNMSNKKCADVELQLAETSELYAECRKIKENIELVLAAERKDREVGAVVERELLKQKSTELEKSLQQAILEADKSKSKLIEITEENTKLLEEVELLRMKKSVDVDALENDGDGRRENVEKLEAEMKVLRKKVEQLEREDSQKLSDMKMKFETLKNVNKQLEMDNKTLKSSNDSMQQHLQQLQQKHSPVRSPVNNNTPVVVVDDDISTQLTQISTLNSTVARQEDVIKTLNDKYNNILRLLQSKSLEQFGNEQVLMNLHQLQIEIDSHHQEKDHIMSILNDKSRENSNLKLEVHSLMSALSASKAAFSKQQQQQLLPPQQQTNLDVDDRAENDEMKKEAVKKLAQIIKDKDVEIEALNQKNVTLLQVLQNESTESMNNEMKRLISEREVQQQHISSLQQQTTSLRQQVNMLSNNVEEKVDECNILKVDLCKEKNACLEIKTEYVFFGVLKKLESLDRSHKLLTNQLEDKERMILKLLRELSKLKSQNKHHHHHPHHPNHHHHQGAIKKSSRNNIDDYDECDDDNNDDDNDDKLKNSGKDHNKIDDDDKDDEADDDRISECSFTIGGLDDDDDDNDNDGDADDNDEKNVVAGDGCSSGGGSRDNGGFEFPRKGIKQQIKNPKNIPKKNPKTFLNDKYIIADNSDVTESVFEKLLRERDQILQGKERKLSELRNQVLSLESEIIHLRSKLSSADTNIMQKESELTYAKKQLETANSKLGHELLIRSDHEKELTELNKRYEEKQKELSEQKQANMLLSTKLNNHNYEISELKHQIGKHSQQEISLQNEIQLLKSQLATTAATTPAAEATTPAAAAVAAATATAATAAATASSQDSSTLASDVDSNIPTTTSNIIPDQTASPSFQQTSSTSNLSEEIERLKREKESRESELVRVVMLMNQERDQLILALQFHQNEALELKNTLSRLQDREKKLMKECDRLREHLLEMEEGYNKEMLDAEAREKMLRSQLIAAEDKIQSLNQSVITDRSDLAKQTESLQNQLHSMIEQRDNALNQLSSAQETISGYSSSLSNLQMVQMEDHTEAIRAAQRLSEQMNKKEYMITALREEVHMREVELKKTEEEIRKLISSTEAKVDKVLMKSLLIGYFHAPPTSRLEAFRVIGHVLNFTSDELKNLENPEHGNKSGWIEGIFGGKKSSSSAAASLSSSQKAFNKSFSELFVSFLERESTPQASIRLPIDDIHPPNRTSSSSSSSSPFPQSSSSRQAPINPFSMPIPLTSSTPNKTHPIIVGHSSHHHHQQLLQQQQPILLTNQQIVPQIVPLIITKSSPSSSTGSNNYLISSCNSSCNSSSSSSSITTINSLSSTNITKDNNNNNNNNTNNNNINLNASKSRTGAYSSNSLISLYDGAISSSGSSSSGSSGNSSSGGGSNYGRITTDKNTSQSLKDSFVPIVIAAAVAAASNTTSGSSSSGSSKIGSIGGSGSSYRR
ncbi:hypothetical protein HELRODRAFT_191137 [Helobdella robusta]|uniref:GRIP domain-containing protein n=1 Tax=Helobdella robusta TaxID=6412 RepID=T1FSM8_HELRO|nr:hypothetical protein HELRODRAFT_191137 [Helobdella robusta]ESO07317.1 hypothetical protein HELRODRAFT_191137 [Helobdella robusta]